MKDREGYGFLPTFSWSEVNSKPIYYKHSIEAIEVLRNNLECYNRKV